MSAVQRNQWDVGVSGIGRAVWRGLGASPGATRGRARLVRAEVDLEEACEEDILVARHATASMLPALLATRAAVCEKSGLLNHLAVLARELGKPCVTGVAGILETIEPGAWLSVDGTRGIVEVEDRRAVVQPRVSASTISEDMVAVMQFGRFTAAFERVESPLELEPLLGIAALAAVPRVFGVGPAWKVVVRRGEVLVTRECLNATVNVLVSRVARGDLRPAHLRSRFDTLGKWAGWSALVDTGSTDRRRLASALGRYIGLVQLAWAASLVRDPLVERYRSFLLDRLGGLDETERQRLFLESLVMPGRSYILRSSLENGETPWSTVPIDPASARARDKLAGESNRNRLAGQVELEARLSPADFRRATEYMAALTDLADITERKNTDLHRCARALFAGEERRRDIAELLRLPSDGSPEALVEIALDAISSFPSVSY